MIKLLADENIPPAVVGFFEKEDSMLRKLMKEGSPVPRTTK